MKLPLTLVVCLCTIAFGASKTSDETFRVLIEERGTLVAEEVEVKGDVIIYRVPAHNDVLASTVVLDYSKGLKVWHVPAQGTCYATTLHHAKPEPHQQTAGLHKFSGQNSLLHANAAHVSSIGYIRSPKPLADWSFLPFETQGMCEGAPVFWSTAVDMTNKTQGRFLIKANPEDVPPPESKRTRRGVLCKASDFYQNCDVNSGESCFYIINCPTVNPTGACLEHVRNTLLTCRVCCNTPGYKGPSKLPHCSKLNGIMGTG